MTPAIVIVLGVVVLLLGGVFVWALVHGEVLT